MSTTWDELQTEIIDELDLSQEEIVDDTELLGFANDAIRSIASNILSINEGKYFEADDTISLTAGVASYDLPAGIFAAKITGLYYISQDKYQVGLVKNKRELLDVGTNSRFRYRISNNAADGRQITFYPTPAADEANVITIYFIREASLIVDTTSLVDIPEAKSFIKQYVKDRVMNKERMNFDGGDSPKLMAERTDLLDALTTMLVDGSDLLEADFSYHNDMECL